MIGLGMSRQKLMVLFTLEDIFQSPTVFIEDLFLGFVSRCSRRFFALRGSGGSPKRFPAPTEQLPNIVPVKPNQQSRDPYQQREAKVKCQPFSPAFLLVLLGGHL